MGLRALYGTKEGRAILEKMLPHEGKQAKKNPNRISDNRGTSLRRQG